MLHRPVTEGQFLSFKVRPTSQQFTEPSSHSGEETVAFTLDFVAEDQE